MAVQQRHVQITSPCPVKLDPARGRDGAKSWYCGHCEKSVHVLSNMTEKEARSLLAERVGQDLCVSYAVHGDGSVRFRPEPEPAPLVPLSSLRRRAGVAAALGVSAALAACTPHERSEPSQVVAVDPIDAPKWHAAATIPLAEPEPPQMIEGGIGARREPIPEPIREPELMVDGGMRAEPIPEPIPVPGGLMVEPIPEAVDEPCDESRKQVTPKHTTPRPGRMRVRSLTE